MGTTLEVEMEFFSEKELEFIRDGHQGDYVAIHDCQVLVFGKSPAEVVRNLLAKFSNPPGALLIRQILGEERRPLRIRSPKAAKV